MIGGNRSLSNGVIDFLEGGIAIEKLLICAILGIRDQGKHIQVGTYPRTHFLEKSLSKPYVNNGG